MWWPSRTAKLCALPGSRPARGSRATMVAVLLAGVSIGIAGCGIHPLYGPTASGATTQQLMSAIRVAPIPGRVGQRVRNELIFANTGGGNPAPQKYKLQIALKEHLSKSLVEQTGEATSEIYLLNAQFKLVDIASGKVVFTGSALSQAAYDRYDRTFSNVRAQYNAENRAANDLAETIKTRIAAYLATSA